MAATVRIALAQLNLLVGDVAGNAERMIEAAKKARDEHSAHAIAFPELSLTSYPPEDLLFRPGLYRRIDEALARLQEAAAGIDLIVGYPERAGRAVYNAAVVLRAGKVIASYRKEHLPNYGVFDEKRYFTSGRTPCVIDIAGAPVGITICEDVWEDGPIEQSVAAGAKLILNINASPYHKNKHRERYDVVARRARSHQVAVLYLNLVGGQDELVFDGESFVVDAAGEIVQRAPAFTEELVMVEIDCDRKCSPRPAAIAPLLGEEESVYRALVLGVRDYVEKNRFPGVVLGLSGGIDSALTLCIAVDALGAERVAGVLMPSRHTAAMSVEDAQALARALGVRTSVISIEPMFDAVLRSLRDEFRSLAPDATEENIQARIRGMLLMAISNKTGRMVLTTGNKSETAVGYATLYGDMAGGFAVIKDVPKTLVYRLAEHRDAQGCASAAGAPSGEAYPARRMPGAGNARFTVIPRRIFERPPSAELAPDQLDSDSLPPYDVLDAIIERYVERDEAPEDIVKAGWDAAVVERVVSMVDRNEYKRRQAPPGIRITPRAFGRDRRYPITSGYGRTPKR